MGIDDVNIFRVEGLYRQNIVMNQAVSIETGASLGLKEQRSYLIFIRAPNYDGTVDSFGVMARHSDYSNEEVSRVGLGWRRTNEFKLDPQAESNMKVAGQPLLLMIRLSARDNKV